MAKLWASEHCGHDLSQIGPNPLLRSPQRVDRGPNDQGLNHLDFAEAHDHKLGVGLEFAAIGIARNLCAIVRQCFAEPARMMVRAFGLRA